MFAPTSRNVPCFPQFVKAETRRLTEHPSHSAAIHTAVPDDT
jgi:hypothetical protein